MAVDPAASGAAILSLTQSVTLFQALLPKFSDIRKASPNDEDTVRDVRIGEIGAVALTLGIGGMASAITGSSAPAVVALVSCVGLVFLYESALASTREVNTSA